MSLKAKLEAVIYAAEEPVTLTQLAALFAEEALAWQASQQASAAPSVAEPLPLVRPENEDESELAVWPPPAGEPAPASNPEPAPEQPPASDPAPEAAPETEPEPEPAPGAEDADADEKRKARQRDREVRAILRGFLDELIAEYASDERGVEIREIAGGYRMSTKPECHDAVRAFVKSLKPALKLSLPALETLAVVAYKQPVTAPEINEIRGVESNGVLGSLLARKLIATAGRKQVVGRPILYKTTREFLMRFGLKDVGELPSMEEFEKMAANELDEPELAAQATAKEKATGPELEFDESASEDAAEQASATSEAPGPQHTDDPQPHSAAQAENEDPHGDQA